MTECWHIESSGVKFGEHSVVTVCGWVLHWNLPLKQSRWHCLWSMLHVWSMWHADFLLQPSSRLMAVTTFVHPSGLLHPSMASAPPSVHPLLVFDHLDIHRPLLVIGFWCLQVISDKLNPILLIEIILWLPTRMFPPSLLHKKRTSQWKNMVGSCWTEDKQGGEHARRLWHCFQISDAFLWGWVSGILATHEVWLQTGQQDLS